MYFSPSEAASLDNWITGNYGEDGWIEDAFCCNCVYYETGHCMNENSVFFHNPMEAEDECDEWDGVG